jgi:hypothetical protein
MRITTVVLPIVVTAAVLGAFVAGRFIGKNDAQLSAMVATGHISALQSASGFEFATRARQALANSDPKLAEIILVRYAALQVPVLSECTRSAPCAAWVGKLLPTMAQLDETTAAELKLRDGK